MQKNKYKVKATTLQQNNTQQEMVYFRLKKPIQQEEPEYQLIVNRNPRKVHHLNQQIYVDSDNRKQDKTNQLAKLFAGISLKQSAQFFLKRVDDMEVKYSNKGQQIINNDILPRSKKLVQQSHKQMRQKLIAKSRGIKIIDIDQNQKTKSKFIEIGNSQVEVQDMGPMNQYYYVLKKRTIFKEGPIVNLPQGSTHLLDNVQFQELLSDEQRMQQDDQDSNRSSNPDYDYPEQEYHEGDSQDEGVIDRDYYTKNSDQEEYDSQPPEHDQEQLYRRYLKRCKEQKNSSDDQYY